MNTEKTAIPALGNFVAQGKDYFRIFEIETDDDPDVGALYFARHNITGIEKCFTDLAYVATTARKQTPVFSGSEVADNGEMIPPVALPKAILAPVATVAPVAPLVKRGPGRPRKTPVAPVTPVTPVTPVAPVSSAPVASLAADLTVLADHFCALAKAHRLSDLALIGALTSLVANRTLPTTKS